MQVDDAEVPKTLQLDDNEVRACLQAAREMLTGDDVAQAIVLDRCRTHTFAMIMQN